MKLEGHTILITGGSNGIGLGFALEFLNHNNTVIICGRNQDRLNKVKEKFPAIHIKQCDVSVTEQREELYTWTRENYPGLTVFMNNAGLQLHNQVDGNLNPEKLSLEINTNLTAPIHLSSLFIPLLKDKKEAAIINISSGLAFTPLAFMPVYCATKAAIHSFSLSLRHQLKNTGIKVFEIAPPAVDTDLGLDRRENKTQSHGGIPVSEFLTEAIAGLEADNFETAVGGAKGLRAKREEMFDVLNNR